MADRTNDVHRRLREAVEQIEALRRRVDDLERENEFLRRQEAIRG